MPAGSPEPALPSPYERSFTPRSPPTSNSEEAPSLSIQIASYEEQGPDTHQRKFPPAWPGGAAAGSPQAGFKTSLTCSLQFESTTRWRRREGGHSAVIATVAPKVHLQGSETNRRLIHYELSTGSHFYWITYPSLLQILCAFFDWNPASGFPTHAAQM